MGSFQVWRPEVITLFQAGPRFIADLFWLLRTAEFEKSFSKDYSHKCYSSVKYKSISLNCFTKIIKSAPKLNRSNCANKVIQLNLQFTLLVIAS